MKTTDVCYWLAVQYGLEKKYANIEISEFYKYLRGNLHINPFGKFLSIFWCTYTVEQKYVKDTF